MSVAPIRQLKRKRGGGSFEQDFAYTGSVQSVTIPSKGLYKLEVWGAQGGSWRGSGGNGGYSVGYIELNKNQVLYVAVGGQAASFNGGNASQSYEYYPPDYVYSGGGGGATHIAKVSGQLSEIGYASFVTNGNGLIVAGGGGGGFYLTRHNSGQGDYQSNGNSGGGTNGGMSGGSSNYASQSSGFAFGQGKAGGNGGGGGGLYGGYSGSGSENYSNAGGGGGSGYIGGVPQVTYKGQTYSPSTTNGQQSGNGKAKITKIA